MSKDLFIKQSNTMPFFVKKKDGYELWSNDRKLHIIITKKSYSNNERNIQQDFFVSECWMLYQSSWERGDNTTTLNSVEQYIKELDASPYFTQAVAEYNEKNKQSWQMQS